MSLVVTRDDLVEESFGFPSALVLSWVVIGLIAFILGVCCGRCCQFKAPNQPQLLQEDWERLVRRALFFLGRRRRISLAFQNCSGQTLRNNPGSRPNRARRALLQRAHTPTPRILYEGSDPLSKPGRATRHNEEAENSQRSSTQLWMQRSCRSRPKSRLPCMRHTGRYGDYPAPTMIHPRMN